jgi:hypothetical protein
VRRRSRDGRSLRFDVSAPDRPRLTADIDERCDLLGQLRIARRVIATRMKQHEVTVPQIGLIAGTRAMLGAGIALLLSEKLSGEQRRAIGWTLVAVGALTTIPLVLQLFSEDE